MPRAACARHEVNEYQEAGENGRSYFVILNKVKDLISGVKILCCAQSDLKSSDKATIQPAKTKKPD
jgi:hypothetical protein